MNCSSCRATMIASANRPTCSPLAETAQAVRHVLRGLPVDYETLLVGKYIDGLSLDELAASEGATIDAVSSKLARARRAFREAFERLRARH